MMTWHVRYFSPSLNHDLLSPEIATEEGAFEEAWSLAQNGEQVTGIEGPDGEVASAEEVELWFRERQGTAAQQADQGGPEVAHPEPSGPATDVVKAMDAAIDEHEAGIRSKRI